MKRTVSLLVMLLLIARGAYAGPFDGTWSGDRYTVTFKTENGKTTVHLHDPTGNEFDFEAEPFEGGGHHGLTWTGMAGGAASQTEAEIIGGKLSLFVQAWDSNSYHHPAQHTAWLRKI